MGGEDFKKDRQRCKHEATDPLFGVEWECSATMMAVEMDGKIQVEDNERKSGKGALFKYGNSFADSVGWMQDGEGKAIPNLALTIDNGAEGALIETVTGPASMEKAAAVHAALVEVVRGFEWAFNQSRDAMEKEEKSKKITNKGLSKGPPKGGPRIKPKAPAVMKKSWGVPSSKVEAVEVASLAEDTVQFK